MNALLAVPATPKTPRRWNVEDFPQSAAAQLRSAANALQELAAPETRSVVHSITDALTNDAAENFQELRGLIETCFSALCEIDARTFSQLAHEAAYHREQLESIEALGVPLEA